MLAEIEQHKLNVRVEMKEVIKYIDRPVETIKYVDRPVERVVKTIVP